MEHPRDPSSPIAVGPDLLGFAKDLIAELSAGFASDGTFWEVGNFMAGWDPHFGFRDWLRVFRTVPSLRKYLVPALAWNCLIGRRKMDGFSERYAPGRKYNFRYRSFCTDLLVWESIGQALKHFDPDAPARKEMPPLLEGYLGLAFRNCYRVPFEGRDLAMFSYYPRHDHLISPDQAVHKLFFSKDDNVPDIDTTALILGSMLSLGNLFGLAGGAYGHVAEDSASLVGLMEQHVRGKGRYGRESLSYDNGILPGDEGVMTWVFDGHNELDPTSNINILNWLVQIRSVHPELPLERIAALTNGIFRFLDNHVRDGSFLDQRFQSYYPLGPTYLFWRRLWGSLMALPESERVVLDADGAAGRVDAFLAAKGEEIFRHGKAPTNPYDRITAAPFLYEHGILREEAAGWLNPERGLLGHFHENHYEIFHLRYPSKIFCAPVRIPFGCALDLAVLVDKFPPR